MKQEPAVRPCPAPAITESFRDNKKHPAGCSTAQSTWVSMSGVFASFASTALTRKHISTGEAELQLGASGGCLDGWSAHCGMDPETLDFSLVRILPTLIASTGKTELLGSYSAKKSGILHPLPRIKELWVSCTPSPGCQHSPQVCAPAEKIPHSRSRSQTASAAPCIEQKCTPSIFPLKGISCHCFCFLIQ